MQDLTRRSFLKGLLALSVAAAIPKELVKVAESVYSDTSTLFESKNFEVPYIKIDGKFVNFNELSMSIPHGNCNPVYSCSNIGNWNIDQLVKSPPELPEIELVYSAGQLTEYFHGMNSEFRFEIFYPKIPYTIKGTGWPNFNTTEFKLLIDEPSFNTFGFVADLEQYP